MSDELYTELSDLVRLIETKIEEKARNTHGCLTAAKTVIDAIVGDVMRITKGREDPSTIRLLIGLSVARKMG